MIAGLRTIPKRLVKGLEYSKIRRQEKTIPTTILSRSDRKLGRVLETWGDLLTLKLQWKPSANVAVKNSQMSKIIIQDEAWLGWKDNPLVIAQNTKFCPW